MWYVEVGDAVVMRSVYAACACTILLLWTFFPSRIAVAIVGAIGLFFPHLLYAPDVRPLFARTIDFAGVSIAAVAIALLVLATHLRLQTKKTAGAI